MATRSISITGSIYLSPWQLSAQILLFVAVLQLSQLDLNSNNITGTLPSTWSSLKQVSMLLLHLLCLTSISCQTSLLIPSPGFLVLLYQLTN